MMDIDELANDPTLQPKKAANPNDGSKIIIKAIGVGGGGNNAVNHMYSQGIENVKFVVCNTDLQALNNSPVTDRVLLGPNTTNGLGAGNKPEVAREAAEESAPEISALFNDDTKMVFITAGMGGGTGTGAGPVVARLAREAGMLTVGIVTIPFLFEGEKKILKALDGADEMSKYVDALLVINNERLTDIYSDLDFLNAFGKADDTLTTAARSIAEIITNEGKINLDFNDVNSTLKDGGAAIISSGYGEGENRVTKAIEDALNSPLLKNRDIYGSKKLLFNLYFSRKAKKQFKMSEASELTAFMTNLDPSVDVIWGVAFDDTLEDKVKITILAAGFDVTIRKEEEEIRNNSHNGPIIFSPQKTPQRTPVETSPEGKKRIIEEYGKGVEDARAASNREKYVVLTPGQMDDDSVIEQLEKAPAYNRNKEVTASIKNTSANGTKPNRPNTTDPDNGNIITFD